MKAGMPFQGAWASAPAKRTFSGTRSAHPSGAHACAYSLMSAISLDIANSSAQRALSGTAFYAEIRRMPPKKWGHFWGRRFRKEHVTPPERATL